MEQVHKETLEQVENALPGRESIDLEIFGTEGIPESEVAAHNQRIMAEYAQKEADRRAASGQSNGPKRPKIDISKEIDPEEIKKKLEAHKKAMASGGATPVTPVGGNLSPGRSQSPAGFDTHGSPQVPSQVSYVSASFSAPAIHTERVVQPQASSPPSFQQGQFGMPQSAAFPPAPANSFPPAPYAPQPPNAYPTAPYAQHAYPPRPPAPYGRGGPQQPFNGYQQPPVGYGAPPFNGHNQFQQNAPPHMQPQRHSISSLPLPHQIPGLPPKPNVPGLPPRPSFANPPSGFARGTMPGPPPAQWSPPAQQPMFNPVGPPVPGPGFNGPAAYGAPSQPAQAQQFSAGYGVSQQQPPQAYSGLQASPVPANATPQGQPQAHVSMQPERLSGTEPPAAQSPPEASVEKEEPPPPAKPKRETRLVYGENDISPVSIHTRLPECLLSFYAQSRKKSDQRSTRIMSNRRLRLIKHNGVHMLFHAKARQLDVAVIKNFLCDGGQWFRFCFFCLITGGFYTWCLCLQRYGAFGSELMDDTASGRRKLDAQISSIPSSSYLKLSI
jgi:hypothetical protein